MSSASHERLLRLVDGVSKGVIYERRSEIRYYLEKNYSVETKGEESKFVNIAGGPEDCLEITSATGRQLSGSRSMATETCTVWSRGRC